MTREPAGLPRNGNFQFESWPATRSSYFGASGDYTEVVTFRPIARLTSVSDLYVSIGVSSQGLGQPKAPNTISRQPRFPIVLMGDLESELAGCLLGRDLASALFEKRGVPKMRAAIEAMWARSEKIARAAVVAARQRAANFFDCQPVRKRCTGLIAQLTLTAHCPVNCVPDPYCLTFSRHFQVKQTVW